MTCPSTQSDLAQILLRSTLTRATDGAVWSLKDLKEGLYRLEITPDGQNAKRFGLNHLFMVAKGA